MALNPGTLNGRDRLQPGARSEIFNPSLPGYRDGADRLNRTNMSLNASAHDVPNIKYQFDYRLPVLFKYGFAVGFNQIVIPKGRIVALDPNMNMIDTDMRVPHNTMTLANGGVPVRVRTSGDKYNNVDGIVSTAAKNTTVSGVGKEWIASAGMAAAWTATTNRPFVKATAVNTVKYVASTASDKPLYVKFAADGTQYLCAALTGTADVSITVGGVKVIVKYDAAPSSGSGSMALTYDADNAGTKLLVNNALTGLGFN